MSDPRLTPANTRVAAADLTDAAPGLKRVIGDRRQIATPLVDLRREPGGARDRQLLFGDAVTVYENRRGWSFVQAAKDGYVGYLRTNALGPQQGPTHWISAPSTHVYPAPDIKSPELMALSFGSRITACADSGGFVATDQGYIPAQHVLPIGEVRQDPVETATLFLGTPYLWGGNSRFGIDCSGLVQAALLAAGIACPGDSDLQQQALSAPLPTGTPPRRNDLLFWRDHIVLVAGADRVLHANAHHMSVVFEPLSDAVQRIERQGGGKPTAHVRPLPEPA